MVVMLVAGCFLLADPSAYSQDKKKVPGELKAVNVKLVIYAKGDQVGGAFYQTGPGKWTEYNDHRHEFKVVKKENNSVYLVNTSATSGGTGYEVRLDLTAKKVFQTLGGGPERELYAILKAYN